MEVTTEVSKVINLQLTEEEAEWLRGAMQNPLCGCNPDEESMHNRLHRIDLFDALAAVK